MVEKAYTPPIAYSKKNYTEITKQDFITTIINSGTRINIYGFLINAIDYNKDIYTVPAGKTLFLINAQLTHIGTGKTWIVINGTDVLFETHNALLGQNTEQQMSYNPFLKFNSSESFRIQRLILTDDIYINMFAYEIDTSLIPNFF